MAAIPETLARVLDLEPEIERIAHDQARRDPGARSSPAASSTRPPASGRSSSRSWPGVFADPYSAADFQHGPLTLVEPGVPVLAVVRAGAPGVDLVALLGRLRDELGGELMIVSDDDPAHSHLATMAGPPPVRHPRVARPDTVLAESRPVPTGGYRPL